MPMLLEMLTSQKYNDINSITKRTLPKIGYIAYLDGMPIAAGFLRRVEPCYAQIDTLCTNAYCGSILRNAGVKAVVDALLNEAKTLKLEGVIAFSRDEGTISRAKSIGFSEIPQTYLALSLQGSSS